MFKKTFNLLCLMQILLVNSQIIDFKQNTCDTFSSYIFQFVKFNKKCYRNENIGLTLMEQIILQVGNAAENYTVITPDGYILEIYRMRKNNPKGVIMLQHAFSTDARIWLVEPKESVALKLWNLGYDVWLPCHRGTKKGQKHVNPLITNKEFWDFDFDEIAIYDYSTFINFIYDKVNRKIIFIGLSMASTSGIVYASLKPNEAVNKLQVMIPLATVTYIHHIKGITKYAIPFYRILQIANEILGIYAVFDEENWPTKLSKFIVYILPIKKLCADLIWFIAGNSPNDIDPAMIYAVASALISSPYKSLFHFAQMYNEKNFVKYNYGKSKNLKVYNQTTPPAYPIQNIQVPIYLIISNSDFVSTIEDNMEFFEKLPEKARIYGTHEISGVGHMDYFGGLHRNERIWNHIAEFLDNKLVN